MKQVNELGYGMAEIFQYRETLTPLEPRRAILHGQWVGAVHLED